MNSRMASFDCADLYREHAFLSLTPEGRDLSHIRLRP
jgi:hypothetical protein